MDIFSKLQIDNYCAVLLLVYYYYEHLFKRKIFQWLLLTQIWKVKNEKGACSCYSSWRIIILRNWFCFWFKKLFATRVLHLDNHQQQILGEWCVEERWCGNTIACQILNYLFHSVVMSKICSKCNFAHVFFAVSKPYRVIKNTQPTFTCSKLIIDTLKKGTKYVQR